MGSVLSFLSLETIIVGAVVLLVLYKFVFKDWLFSGREPVKWEPPKPIEPRDFTLEELRVFDGTNNNPIYVAVKGKVYDMTRARDFYGPGGPYHVFAGRDASRALALHSTDPKDVENSSLEGLTADELDTLNDFIMTFEAKYPVVGYLKQTTGTAWSKTSDTSKLSPVPGKSDADAPATDTKESLT
jgi:membrane-associated progesterone receptor component